MELVPLASKIYLLSFYPHVEVGPVLLCVHPPTSLDVCVFFNSVVVTFPFNSISDGSECWLFYILIVILMWLCEKASRVYLCAILIRLEVCCNLKGSGSQLKMVSQGVCVMSGVISGCGSGRAIWFTAI